MTLPQKKPLPKRGYQTVSIAEHASGGWSLLADGKPAKSPRGKQVVIPSHALAEVVMHEWQQQCERVDGSTMPMTRICCIALDLIGEQREEIERDIAAFAETDQLYFRETKDEKLRRLQDETLTPVLAWAEKHYNIHITLSYGVMVTPQDDTTSETFARLLAQMSDMELAAFSLLVKYTSSFVLGLALKEGYISPEDALSFSHLDEIYQAEQWGKDEEAEDARASLAGEIITVCRFIRYLSIK